eukprot:906281-Rhodomonas_salina.1
MQGRASSAGAPVERDDDQHCSSFKAAAPEGCGGAILLESTGAETQICEIQDSLHRRQHHHHHHHHHHHQHHHHQHHHQQQQELEELLGRAYPAPYLHVRTSTFTNNIACDGGAVCVIGAGTPLTHGSDNLEGCTNLNSRPQILLNQSVRSSHLQCFVSLAAAFLDALLCCAVPLWSGVALHART